MRSLSNQRLSALCFSRKLRSVGKFLRQIDVALIPFASLLFRGAWYACWKYAEGRYRPEGRSHVILPRSLTGSLTSARMANMHRANRQAYAIPLRRNSPRMKLPLEVLS